MTRNVTWRRLAVATLLLARGASSLSAQPTAAATPPSASDKDDVVVLSAFTVNSGTDRGYQAVNSISGSRLNEPIKNVPLSITVITPELLSDLDADTYDEALKFQSSYNPSNQRIRGLTAFVNNRNSAGVDGELDTTSIDRVEVVKGPATLMYGVTAAGGQVNAISKRAGMHRNRYTFDAQVGSFDRLRFRGDLNQVILPGKLATRLSLKTEEASNPDSDFSKRSADFAQWTTSYQPFTGTMLTFEIEANRPEQPLNNAILRQDANTTGLPNSSIPFAVLYGTPEKWEYSKGTARRRLEHTIYRLDWEQKWIPGLVSLVTYNVQDRVRKGDNTSLSNTSTPPTGGAAGRYLRVNWRDENYTVDATTFESMVKYDFGSNPAWKHSFLLRYQNRQYDDRNIVIRSPVTQDSFVRLTGVTDWSNNYALRPNNLTFTEVFKDSSIWDNTSDLEQYSASYMPKFETSHGTLRLTYGVVSQKQIKTDGRPFTAANYALRDPLPVSVIEPSGGARVIRATDVQEGTTTLAGASFAPNDHYTFYTVVTGSFRPTATRNSFGQILPPRRGKTNEWGVKFDNLFGDRISGSLAYFNTLEYNNNRRDPNIPNNTSLATDGLPLFTQDAAGNYVQRPGAVFDPNGPAGDQVAVGRYRSTGWDTEIFVRLVGNFDSILTYSYIDAATEFDPDTLQIGRIDSGTAKHTIGVFGKYSFREGVLKGLQLTAGYRWSTKAADQYRVVNGQSILFEREGDNTYSLGARYSKRFNRVEWFAQTNIDDIWAPDREVGNRSNSTVRYKFDTEVSWKLMTGVSF